MSKDNKSVSEFVITVVKWKQGQGGFDFILSEADNAISSFRAEIKNDSNCSIVTKELDIFSGEESLKSSLRYIIKGGDGQENGRVFLVLGDILINALYSLLQETDFALFLEDNDVLIVTSIGTNSKIVSRNVVHGWVPSANIVARYAAQQMFKEYKKVVVKEFLPESGVVSSAETFRLFFDALGGKCTDNDSDQEVEAVYLAGFGKDYNDYFSRIIKKKMVIYTADGLISALYDPNNEGDIKDIRSRIPQNVGYFDYFDCSSNYYLFVYEMLRFIYRLKEAHGENMLSVVRTIKYHETKTRKVFLLSSGSHFIVPLTLFKAGEISKKFAKKFAAKQTNQEKIASALDVIGEALYDFIPGSMVDYALSNKVFKDKMSFLCSQALPKFNVNGAFFKIKHPKIKSSKEIFMQWPTAFDNAPINHIEELLGEVDVVQINCNSDDYEDNGASRFYAILNSGMVLPIHFLNNQNMVQIKAFVLAKTAYMAKYTYFNQHVISSYDSRDSIIYDNKREIQKIKNFILNLGVNKTFQNRYIYLFSSTAKTESLDQFGYVAMLTNDKLDYLALQALRTIMNKLFDTIYYGLMLNDIKIAQIQSAIGSIMSRNGSHNIGSHVLAALSHNVGTMPDDRVLYQYIQHRMDYIATATTDFPTWSSETKLVNGLIRQFLSQRHLLDYIAGSEGLHSFKFQDPNISEDAEQPNTIRLRIRKLDEKGNPHEFIRYKGVEATADFDDDVAVAIPGGVIGGHAFFTILENVIRNAAKHGWAKTSEKKKNYLEIFVDFKCSDSNRTIEIDVYDGLSNVFAISKKKIVAKEGGELTPEENATNKAIENLCVEINKWKENARDPLSTRKQNENEKAEEELLADYLSGKSDTLPKLYDPIKAFLSGEEKVEGSEKPFKRCKLLSDILTGTTDNDDDLGHRLWLPLHHSQQLKLAKQFIDESGALRKENWGLAEMKISAGYLNRRPISEIGGLDKVDPIITPKCEAGADGGAHLSYHFWIPVPREIAFVCDTKNIDSNKITELRSYGIYVVNSPIDGQYVKPKNKGDEDWNYSYVVLPKFPEQKDPHLPFRVLARDDNTKRKDMDNVQCLDMVPSAAGFYDTIKNKLIEGDSTAKDIADTLKKSIYDKWKEYWYSTRRDLGINNIPILEVSAQRKGGNRDKNNGESSLVYNIDVWRFVVRELFRSIVGHFLSDVQAGNVGASKEVLAFLELMSIACKNDAKNAFFSFPGSERLIDQINKQKTISEKLLCELLLKEFLNWFSILKQDCQSQGYCVKLEKFREDYSLKTREPLAQLINDAERIMVLVQSKQCQYDYNRTNPLFIDEEGFDNGLLGFAQRMLNGYREADVMLRKYEERILTLPVIFTKNEGDENAKVHSQGSGGKRIVYERHAGVDDFLPNQMLYHESLSGTQSYIYDLIQYQNITGSQKISTMLYESGLARVVIIDERVSRFLRDRPEMIKTFCHMGIWCVDETNFSDKGSNFHDAILNNNLEAFGSLLVLDKTQIDGFINSFQNESSKSDGETGKNRGEERRKVFDVLIIHQGIIDKWLSHAGADCKKVEKFIQKIKMEIPYVVITTGRGTPANIPDSARILPFSIIEATLFKKHPEKLVLVDTIMSILPIGEHQ